MRSLFFPQNINGAQLDIQLGGGMERAIIVRVARKKMFCPSP